MPTMFMPVSVEQMHIIADYLYALYEAKVHNLSSGLAAAAAAAAAVVAPLHIQLSLMAECEQLSTVLAHAYWNQSQSTSIIYECLQLNGRR